MSPDELPEPPPPPEAPRRIRLYRFQWIGLAILVVVPILAIAGVFGSRATTHRAASATLDVTARIPARFRYLQIVAMDVTVRNRSPAPLDTVRVALDTALATRFSMLSATPPFTDAFESVVTALAPGESRLVRIELRGARVGRHAGVLRVIGSDSVVVPVRILIFP